MVWQPDILWTLPARCTRLGDLTLLGMDPLTIPVAVVIFAFVVTLVLAVFGQRGRAEISPEREVAIAAGHADRRTVFEIAALQPIMWLLLSAARSIPAPRMKEKLRRTLVAAGSPNFYTPAEYLALCFLAGLVLFGAVLLLNVMMGAGLSLFLPIIALVAGVALALYYLKGKAAKRVRTISKRIPYTLDLISLAMGAGATFTEAVRTVIREDPAHPFNMELNTVLAEIELGTTRAQALRNLSDRIPLEGLRSIIAAVIQAEGLGTPLSDVLKQQADLLRLQRSVRAEKQAASASVRILVPGLLILLSVVLSVFATVIIRAIKHELF